MGAFETLTAADGHGFTAYRAVPEAAPRGALVVLQEIFGVNSHMRGVADGFARDGYLCLAPALFDRVKSGVELGYGPDDVAAGRALRAQIPIEGALADIAACIAALRGPGGGPGGGRVGVIGYCWGGSLAWLAATRLEVDCAIGYYGGQIAEHRTEKARCPVMLHFGDADSSIPPEDIAAIQTAQPEVSVFRYPGAGHGFNCEQRGSYDAECAAQARSRSLTFLRTYLG